MKRNWFSWRFKNNHRRKRNMIWLSRKLWRRPRRFRYHSEQQRFEDDLVLEKSRFETWKSNCIF